MRNRWWVAPCTAAAVLVIAACGSSGSPSSSASSHSASAAPAAAGTGMAAGIKTASTSMGTVLTTAKGFTIYWFALDTPTKSNCNGSCAAFWPPVTGHPSAASGVSLPGKWGTIKRSNGALQATYDGHPLYTYKGDTSPGQVKGNGLNLSGGKWWAMTPSGAKLAAHPSPTSSSSSSGGYGY
jgi:predicted lipoprotein with Yx(FWY)xxD motif